MTELDFLKQQYDEEILRKRELLARAERVISTTLIKGLTCDVDEVLWLVQDIRTNLDGEGGIA